MPEQTSPESNVQEKVSVKEFIKMAKWAFLLVYKIHPVYTIAYLIFIFISDIRGLANSLVIAKILDYIVNVANNPNASIKDVYPAIGVLVIIDVVFSIINFFQLFSRRALFITLYPKLDQSLYIKVNSLGIQSLEDPEVNNKINRADMYLRRVPELYQNVATLISSLFSGLVTLAIIVKLSPVIGIAMVILLIPKFLNDKKYRKLAWRLDFDSTEDRRKAYRSAAALTDTSKLQEIFINNIFSYLDKKFSDFTNWFVGTSIKLRKKWYRGLYTYDLLSNIGIYYGLWVIFSKFISKALTIGDVYFQMNNLQRFQGRMDTVFQIYNDMFDLALRVRDAYELYQLEPSFPDGNTELELLKKGPSVEFKNLTFKYPHSEKIVLNNVNFKINPGEKVAIVGHNGAGKTTLVRLICRMYKTPQGSVFINDRDIDELKQRSLHNNLGVLFQEFVKYTQLTPRENIYVGDPTRPIDEERIIAAAKNAEAHEFIQELPNKFDQILEEKFKGGVKLSTGQWQKLAIARFFYRDAPLVVFDEPTASIDAESEYKIFNQIYNFFRDKTVIIISHRFSTVRNADKIVVINKGEIVEQGTHNELLQLNGFYAKSFNLQAEGYKSEKVESII